MSLGLSDEKRNPEKYDAEKKPVKLGAEAEIRLITMMLSNLWEVCQAGTLAGESPRRKDPAEDY